MLDSVILSSLLTRGPWNWPETKETMAIGSTNVSSMRMPSIAITRAFKCSPKIMKTELLFMGWSTYLPLFPPPFLTLSGLSCRNRAACYLEFDPPQFEQALRECDLALAINPNFVKGLVRRAKACKGLGRLEEAQADVQRALQVNYHQLFIL